MEDQQIITGIHYYRIIRRRGGTKEDRRIIQNNRILQIYQGAQTEEMRASLLRHYKELQLTQVTASC